MLILLAGSALTLAALLATRPRLEGGPTSWSSDDLAFVGLWSAGVIASAWLTATTLACVAALTRGSARTAHRIASWAPPLARRLLQGALLSTWALVPAVASAAPIPAPITIHVSAGGRLSSGSPRGSTGDAPVVRAPAPPSSTSARPTTTRPATTPPAPTPTTAPPVATPRLPSGHRRPAVVTVPAIRRSYVVQPGDNLWRISRAEVIRASGDARRDDSRIAPYWQRVIEANRSTLRSGNPSLIFPGEMVVLPPFSTD